MSEPMCVLDHGDDRPLADVGFLCQWHRNRMSDHHRAEWTDVPYTAPMTLPRSVIAQLALLAHNHDWIAAQAWVDDYVAEMGELHKALKATVRDHATKRIGHCRLPVADRVCGGTLLAENGTGVIRCVACRSTWTTAQEQARLAVTLDRETL